MILVRTDHPCLRVGRHSEQRLACTFAWSILRRFSVRNYTISTGISVLKQVKDYQLPRHKDALQGWPACFLRRLGSTWANVPAPAWDVCRKASKSHPKIISIATKCRGLQGLWYGGSSIWVITWLARGLDCLCLRAGGGHFLFSPPAEGAVASTWSTTKGWACPNMSIGLGAMSSVEVAPLPSASSPTGSFSTLLSPSDSSTSTWRSG
jgi:hypothetical protein